MRRDLCAVLLESRDSAHERRLAFEGFDGELLHTYVGMYGEDRIRIWLHDLKMRRLAHEFPNRSAREKAADAQRVFLELDEHRRRWRAWVNGSSSPEPADR